MPIDADSSYVSMATTLEAELLKLTKYETAVND